MIRREGLKEEKFSTEQIQDGVMKVAVLLLFLSVATKQFVSAMLPAALLTSASTIHNLAAAGTNQNRAVLAAIVATLRRRGCCRVRVRSLFHFGSLVGLLDESSRFQSYLSR